MPFVHIVILHFPNSVPEDVAKATLSAAETLKTKCLHPATKEPYILSFKAGRDCSTEGAQDGITHTFVLEFESKEDHDYYANKDPEHLLFKEKFKGNGFTKIQITDFEVGGY